MIFFGKTIFPEHLEKENMVFRAVMNLYCIKYLMFTNDNNNIMIKREIDRGKKLILNVLTTF